jgi:hypothetical protein
MTHSGDVGTEFAPEVADDPDLAARLDDLLYRTCSLARALTGAEQAAFSVDLDGDGHAARKFFNLSTRYERWRDYRVDPQGSGYTASIRSGRGGAPHAGGSRSAPTWTFGDQAPHNPPLRGWLATSVYGEDGRCWLDNG